MLKVVCIIVIASYNLYNCQLQFVKKINVLAALISFISKSMLHKRLFVDIFVNAKANKF